MNLSGGTLLAQQFIEKYLVKGCLVNPYSADWITKIQGLVENGDIDYDSDSDTYASFDESFGDDYHNHLLVLYISPYDSELLKDLRTLDAPFKDLFDPHGKYASKHKPDFLFINLATRQVFGVGLGRKNRLIQYDVERYIKDQTEPIIDLLQDEVSTDLDNNYAMNFLKLDHDGIVKRIIYYLRVIGESLTALEELNFNPEMVRTEPNEDGLFEFEDGREPIGQEELESLNYSYEIAMEELDGALAGIKVFFPSAEYADLNTEDY